MWNVHLFLVPYFLAEYGSGMALVRLRITTAIVPGVKLVATHGHCLLDSWGCGFANIFILFVFFGCLCPRYPFDLHEHRIGKCFCLLFVLTSGFFSHGWFLQ